MPIAIFGIGKRNFGGPLCLDEVGTKTCPRLWAQEFRLLHLSLHPFVLLHIAYPFSRLHYIFLGYKNDE